MMGPMASDGGSTGTSPNLKPPWKAGQSGNPSGRPKGDAWFRKLCRKRTVRALKALERVMSGGEDGPAVSAAKALLEFGWGRAPQVVTIDDAASARLDGLDDAELLAMARAELGSH